MAFLRPTCYIPADKDCQQASSPQKRSLIPTGMYGDLHTRAWFATEEVLEVDQLLGTSYIENYICDTFPMDAKNVKIHPHPVAILMSLRKVMFLLTKDVPDDTMAYDSGNLR